MAKWHDLYYNIMYTTNGMITEVVECHEFSNLRRSEIKIFLYQYKTVCKCGIKR